MHAVVAMVFATVLISNVSHAVGPAINAKVYDGQPATLTIVSPENNTTVGTSPVSVEGTVHNISQIMVYVDDVYSMTYPIDDGTESYIFNASVGSGMHTLKLIAVNPYNGTTVEETVSFTYTPGAEPSVPVEAVKTVAENAKITKDYLQNQVDQASATEPATFLSNAAYTAMSALDLIPTSGQSSVSQMAARFLTVSAGTALIILTQPMISLYHLTRYRLMEWNVHALPEIVQHHAAFVLRAGGALLVMAGFFI